MEKFEPNKNYLIKLKKQKASLGHLKFEYVDDINFSNWYTLTENIVIGLFGQKSNQLNQLKAIKIKMKQKSDMDYSFNRTISGNEARESFKNLLQNYIEELKLDPNMDDKKTKKKDFNIKINNTQLNSQTINVSNEIKNIINNIKSTESDPEKVSEAEGKLEELEREIRSENPLWSKIKDILIWSLNFSRDVFLQILPILLSKYNK